MADTTISYRVEIRQSNESQKKLVQLQTAFDQANNALKKLNAQERKGTVTASQASKQRAVLTTQLQANRNALNDTRASILKNNNALRKNSGFVNGVSQGMRQFAKSMLLPILSIRALTKVLSSSLKIIKNFDQSQADLASVLGKSRKEIKGLTEDAKKLGATTKFTASEVASLQKEYAKLGFTEQEILNVTEATLQLAAATGEDLAQSAEIVGSTIRAFGLDALDTQRVVDVMAQSFSSSSLDMEKFAVSMRNVAPVAKNAGLSIERTTALLGTLTDNGIDASTAGTGLRNVFLELSKRGLTFEEAMTKINNASDKNAASLELFGKRGAVVGTIIAGTSEKTEKLEKSLNNAAGAAERMANEQLDTLSGQTKLLNSAWEGFILSLEDGNGVIAVVLRNAIGLTTTFLEKLTALTKGDAQLRKENREENKQLLFDRTTQEAIEENIVALQKESNKTLKEIAKGDGFRASTAANILQFRKAGVTEIQNELLLTNIIAQRKAKSLITLREELKERVKLGKTLFLENKIRELKQKSGQLAAFEEFRTSLLLKASEEELIKLTNLRGKANEGLSDLAAEELQRRKDIGEVETFNAENAGKTEKELKEAAKKREAREKEEAKRLADIARLLAESRVDIIKDQEAREIAASKARFEKQREIITGNSKNEIELRKNLVELEERQIAEIRDKFGKKRAKDALDLDRLIVNQTFSEQKRLLELEIAQQKLLSDEERKKLGDKEKTNSDLIQLEITRLEMQKELNEIFSEDVREIDEQILDEKQKLALEEININQKKNDEKLLSDKQAAQRSVDNQLALLDVLGNAFTAFFDAQKEKTDRALSRELTAIQDQSDTQVSVLENRLQQGSITEAQFDAQKTAVDAQRQAAELDANKKAFEKKKKLDLAFTTLEYLKELAAIAANAAANPGNAFSFGAVGVSQNAFLAAIATANFGIRAATIKAQQFKKGGLLSGASHDAGGIPFTIGGVPGFEAEHGEALMTKGAVQMFGKQLSAMNVAGGGKAFRFGGVVTPTKFQSGDVLMSGNRPVASRAVPAGFDSVEILGQVIGDTLNQQLLKLQVVNDVKQTESVLSAAIEVENDVDLG